MNTSDPQDNQPGGSYTPPPSGPVTQSPDFQGPPVMTKAALAAACGFFSMPTCVCFGFPSIILGVAAIYLGSWVRKNYRGNTASEMANLLSWVGTITGCIGILLGLISILLWIFTGTAGVIGSFSETRY